MQLSVTFFVAYNRKRGSFLCKLKHVVAETLSFVGNGGICCVQVQ
jgi:hypothetical protein